MAREQEYERRRPEVRQQAQQARQLATAQRRAGGPGTPGYVWEGPERPAPRPAD